MDADAGMAVGTVIIKSTNIVRWQSRDSRCDSSVTQSQRWVEGALLRAQAPDIILIPASPQTLIWSRVFQDPEGDTCTLNPTP